MAALATPAVAAAQAPDPGRLAALVDSLAAAELAGGPTAGLAVAVWQGGALRYARGYGLADLEHGVPVGIETVFKLGSVTKQFTAVALLQLVERGRLSLEDDVGRHLPELDTGGRRITVARLLDHTSGIRSYTALGPAVSRDSFRLDLTPERLVALLQGQPFDFEPGAGWRYNNSGFLLAAMIVERVSGQRYADYLREHVFAPLGLTATSYCDERAIVPHRATGYVRTPAGFARGVGESMAIPHGAGALCSTVLDLVRFRAALGSGALIATASYERMIRPAVLADGWRTNYGFGLARYRLGDVEVIRHGGSITGFQANLLYVPGLDLIVAALANTGGADPVGVSDAIVRAVAGQPLAPVPARPLAPEAAARLAGRYQLGPSVLELRARDGALAVGLEGVPVAARLDWLGGRRFRASTGFALGFYAGATELEIAVDRPPVDAFLVHHPLGGTVRAVRLP